LLAHWITAIELGLHDRFLPFQEHQQEAEESETSTSPIRTRLSILIHLLSPHLLLPTGIIRIPALTHTTILMGTITHIRTIPPVTTITATTTTLVTPVGTTIMVNMRKQLNIRKLKHPPPWNAQLITLLYKRTQKTVLMQFMIPPKMHPTLLPRMGTTTEILTPIGNTKTTLILATQTQLVQLRLQQVHMHPITRMDLIPTTTISLKHPTLPKLQ
jgi:hypothetical protein